MSQHNMKCRVSELGTRHQQHKCLIHSLDHHNTGCRLQWANLIGNLHNVSFPRVADLQGSDQINFCLLTSSVLSRTRVIGEFPNFCH